jgi:hypothetical protein
MVVNDNAGYLDARVAPAFFASRLAPTGSARFVGASLLAKDGNDHTGCLDERVFASRLIPTTAGPANPGQPDEKKP